VSQFSLTSDFGATFTPFECPANMGIVSTIEGVSSDGKMVGTCSDLNTGTHSFLYSNGQFTFINDLPGAEQPIVRGVNKKGQIVGTFCEAHCLPIRGFIGTPVKGKKTKKALVIN
jgi:probable HAF family extracellular repeat protein